MSFCTIDEVVKRAMELLDEVVTKDHPNASEREKAKIKADILNAYSREWFYSGPRKEH
jgi:hypothetical protein